MNWLILSAVLALAALSAAEENYAGNFDNIDIHEVLANKRLTVAYIKCMLDTGKCTPEGKELKGKIQDGIQTACSKCTDSQKEKVRTVAKHMMENEKDHWEQLKAKYDPGDKYKPIYEPFLAGQN